VFFIYTITALRSDERLEGKVFTHPHYTTVEARMMRFMIQRLCQIVESLHSSHSENTGLQIREMLEPDSRYHRALVIQPAQLAQRVSFTVVGFFGQRNFDAQDKESWQRDALLFSEMQNHQGLLSYSTLELTNGDYCNTILFSDEASKNHWGRSSIHEKAVREFSPTFYHSIRLYNGVLEASLMEAHKIRLTSVKYFDYSVTPAWIGMRTL
jgi:hypothetical protein